MEKIQGNKAWDWGPIPGEEEKPPLDRLPRMRIITSEDEIPSPSVQSTQEVKEKFLTEEAQWPSESK